MTWMEVLASAHDPGVEDVVDLFLRDFGVLELSRRIAREGMEIRRVRRIRLPDAIVWASARAESAELVTRNTKGFPRGEKGCASRIPSDRDGAPQWTVSAGGAAVRRGRGVRIARRCSLSIASHSPIRAINHSSVTPPLRACTTLMVT